MTHRNNDNKRLASYLLRMNQASTLVSNNYYIANSSLLGMREEPVQQFIEYFSKLQMLCFGLNWSGLFCCPIMLSY